MLYFESETVLKLYNLEAWSVIVAFHCHALLPLSCNKWLLCTFNFVVLYEKESCSYKSLGVKR